MKIALIGYGVMGRQIEEICHERKHEIVLILGKSRSGDWETRLKQADVAIEFTEPDAAVQNLILCFEHGVPVVSGTTGWLGRLSEVKQACMASSGALLYASNFSIGVNLFFMLNKHLGMLMQEQEDYRAQLNESHHIRKKDAPSGTAITLAEGIIESGNVYKKWVLGQTSDSGVLPVLSHREGDIPGTHSIEWKSENDSITITHQAFNRKGFALGAVIAAEFLAGKRGIFTMSDLFKTKLNHGI